MTYELRFVPAALTEWKKLDKAIRVRLAKKLAGRLEHPRVLAAALRAELAGAYKIRDDISGSRLVYWVEDDELIVIVLSVGKRAEKVAYHLAASQLADYIRQAEKP